MISLGVSDAFMKQVKDRDRTMDDKNKAILDACIRNIENEYRNEVEKLISRLRNDLLKADKSGGTDIGSDYVGRCIKQVLENVYKSYSY